MRRLSEIEEAETLKTTFATAHLLALQLREVGKVEGALGTLVTAIAIRADGMDIILRPDALDVEVADSWRWTLSLSNRRPFREARLRIDADAMAARCLVLTSPELSLAQLAKREGRCRTQIARLLRLSWLNPKIIDAIAAGTQPKRLIRRALLVCDMPIDWTEQ